MRFRYQLLGPVTVSGPDGPLRLGGPKQRAVLAALLLNANRVVAEERLFDHVWGDDPPPSVRGQLHVHISDLRKIIGRDAIVRRRPGYLLQMRPGELDLDAFDDAVAGAHAELAAGQADSAAHRLRAALALWQGAALGGVTEPLLALEGPALRERRLSALEDYFHAQLEAGWHIHAVGELRRAAEENPFRERLQSLLMLALHHCGRTPEALEVYAAARERLTSELGLEPGALLRDTQLRLLRHRDRDADLPGSGAVPGLGAGLPGAGADSPGSRGAITPRQLPADVTSFVGRAGPIARLDALLPRDGGPSTAVVAAIGGGAGVGKTSLAVHWGHRVRDRFPDGQLYVNLRGFDPKGSMMSPAEAVCGFLEAFGVSGQRIPAGEAARFSLYRSLLAGKRVLVLLDNARDADQVRPLLPGDPGCLTVVTSRDQMAGLVAVEGAQPISLDLLSAAESRELMARRLGAGRVAAEARAVDRIGDLCARLPLALAIVAARAATNPTFPLAALADELREAHGDLDAFDGGDPASNVRTTFSWSYRTLSPDAARLTRLLGLHPGRYVAGGVAVSLAGLPVRRTRALLAELTRAQLVTEYTPGRYTLHDLLRVYATELAHTHDPEAERRGATHRLLDHYLHTAHSAGHRFSSQPPMPLDPALDGVVPEALTEQQAVDWFAAEYPVILAAIDQAVDAGFPTRAWQLVCTLTTTFFHQRGGWLNEAMTTYRRVLDAAVRRGDLTGQAHSHRGLALVHAGLGHIGQADTHLRRAVDLFGRLGDLAYEADANQGLTWVSDQQGCFELVLHHAERALELFTAAGHRPGQAVALNNVGWGHARLGDHERALYYCHKSLELCEEFPDQIGKATIRDSLGYAHHQLGHYEEAVTRYRQALELYRRSGSMYYETRTLSRLGDAYQAMGDPAAAQHAWRQALSILDNLSHPDATLLRAKLSPTPPLPAGAPTPPLVTS
ncbi:BTAD domain-containing putative transcriptional regulator [Sphaerisporangium sp. NPDC005289]|uniref:AfsR/SARP family transcriptional regulator n=1 Tax=Sphaerisporangium sp. NPDC005289 TaxID=3155247 RepID=UPI0033A7B3E1